MPLRSLGSAGRAVALGLVVAAPASALLVACGGPSDEERYGDAFTEVARPMTAALIDLGNALGVATSRQQVGAALIRADDALETAAAGFGELDPPDDVAETQDELIAAIGHFEDQVKRMRVAVRRDGEREFGRSLQSFSAESRSFAATLGEIRDQLEDAGIPLGELAPA